MLKSGDILHKHTKSLLGTVIRIFETIRYGRFAWSNHSAIILEENGVFYVYEANPKVIRTEYNTWVDDCIKAGNNFIVTRIPEAYWRVGITNRDVKTDCDILLNDDYDYEDLIFKMPIEMVLGNYLQDNSTTKFICSKMVVFILQKYTFLFKQDNICPAKIYEICADFEIIDKR